MKSFFLVETKDQWNDCSKRTVLLYHLSVNLFTQAHSPDSTSIFTHSVVVYLFTTLVYSTDFWLCITSRRNKHYHLLTVDISKVVFPDLTRYVGILSHKEMCRDDFLLFRHEVMYETTWDRVKNLRRKEPIELTGVVNVRDTRQFIKQVVLWCRIDIHGAIEDRYGFGHYHRRSPTKSKGPTDWWRGLR